MDRAMPGWAIIAGKIEEPDCEKWNHLYKTCIAIGRCNPHFSNATPTFKIESGD